MGDPLLLQVAQPVRAADRSSLASLLHDMRETMAALNGAGLAAPQIGISLQVVIFGVGQNARYPDAEVVPPTVLVNPLLSEQSVEMDEAWEGCLSVPGMRGWVPRHLAIRYQGQDEYGRPIDRRVEGFHARVVQHEVDHLCGVLYPMRIRDLSRFGFTQELLPGEELPDE